MSVRDLFRVSTHSRPGVPTVALDRRPRFWLSVLVVAWGTQAIVTQSLLLREALVLMFGSELAWGLVLFAWLLGVAVGATLGGWAAEHIAGDRGAAIGLVVVLLALSIAAGVELWIFRGARAWLGVQPGEFLPLPKTALAAVLFVSPASALVGMAFPLACCVVVRRGAEDAGGRFLGGQCPPYLSFGRVYALECAGSLIGGAAFSFWAIEHLSPIQTALICGAMTAAASAGLLAASLPRCLVASLPRCLLPAIGLAAVLLATLGGDALNRRLIDRRWRTIAPGYELVAETESRYQNLAIGRRADQYTLYCDGQVSGDFPDPYTFVPLAHFWLCQHPSPRTVLVLGGGAEGLLSEILRHPVEHVDYVEPDPRQIELLKPLLTEMDRQALGDPRVAVHQVDARHYIKTQSNRFDLVIARLPEPTSALRARFYTDEFYGELRRAMTARSVLCMTAAAAPTTLSAASRDYLASLRATLTRSFPHVTIGWGDPAQVLAATEAGLVTTDPAELARRYAARFPSSAATADSGGGRCPPYGRGVPSPLFDPAWFAGGTDWLAADKLAQRAAELDQARDVQISTDLRPAIYVQRLVLWEAQSSGRAADRLRTMPEDGVVARLRSVSLTRFVGALAAVGAIALVAARLRWRSRTGWAAGAVTVSVGTTGFATMALSIIWLFAFQSLYGYVYQRIGWIIALFMGGLVIGCVLASRRAEPAATSSRSPDWLWRRLIAVDGLMALLALAVPFVLPALAALQAGPAVLTLVEWCISIMVVATGVLGGAAFPLAGRLRLGFAGRAGAAAGSVVGADHAGACLGALLCGVLLVPMFGTVTTALLLAGMKLTSAVLLGVGWRAARAA